jgi:hypothetical protein
MGVSQKADGDDIGKEGGRGEGGGMEGGQRLSHAKTQAINPLTSRQKRKRKKGKV